ncbi:MAG: hypothetical protein ACJ72Z_01030 [Pyrinomonadaceae bacterium]
MRLFLWIKIIAFGIASAVIFTLAALAIDKVVRPEREILMINLKYLVYLIVLLTAAVCGMIVSLAVLIGRSRRISFFVALFVGLAISFGLIKGTFDIYSQTYFDAPMFYADLVQIVLNLAIYPLVSYLVWKIFQKELISNI